MLPHLRRAAVIRGMIAAGRRPRVAMSGTSMRPLLNASMTLVLGPAEAARPGDVLVFAGPQSLVAHRVIVRDADGWITAGDAVRHVERVPVADAVGRVERVEDGTGRRIDGGLWHRSGALIAAQRAARYRLREAVRGARVDAWPALLTALHAVVTDDAQAFVRALASVEATALFEVAQRHRCAGIIAGAKRRWMREAVTDRFARARWQTALRAESYRRDVADVVRALNGAGVRYALLKGAARAYADEPDWNHHLSLDVDVLVEPGDAPTAARALAELGYASRNEAPPAGHHHLAPLVAAQRPPVELHLALAPAWRFSLALDASSMLRRTITVEGPAGTVRVLDEVARIVHLCVHATGHRPLRDVFLAALAWRALDASRKADLHAEIAGETAERTRLAAAFARMLRLAGDDVSESPEVRRYENWVARRERLPDALRERSHVLEIRYGRAPLRTAFNDGLRRGVGRLALAAATVLLDVAHDAEPAERRQDVAHVGLDVA